MDPVAIPPFLQRRRFAYYYRRAIPADFRSALGKSEFVVSLRTTDLREAKRRYAVEHAKAEAILSALDHVTEANTGGETGISHEAVTSFARMAAHQYLDRLEIADNEALLREWPADLDEHRQSIEIEAGNYVSPTPDMAHIQKAARDTLLETGFPIQVGSSAYWTLCGHLNGAHLEHLKRHYRRVLNEPAPFEFRPTGIGGKLVSEQVSVQSKAHTCTIAELIERYDSEPSRVHVRAKTKRSASAPAKRLLLEILGPEALVSDVRREQLIEARSVLLALPPRAAQRFPRMTLRKIAEHTRQTNEARLHPKTADTQLGWITTLFNYAEREQLLISNPAQRLGLGPSVKRETSRTPWPVVTLNALFRSAPFIGNAKHPSQFWGPALALFQGLRMNEACQLFTDDLCVLDGVSSLRIASNPDRGQQTKTNATRLVPIHPTLIDLGIMKLFQTHDGEQAAFIFPDIARDRDGSATNAFSKWFLRLMEKEGLRNRGVAFHSFRHSFADALRRAGVSAEHSDALGGWDTPSSARRGYGHGYRPIDLLPELTKVQYPGLDLSRVVPTF